MFKPKNQKQLNIKYALVLVLPVLLLTSMFAIRQQATAATSNTVNFQARLLTAAGNVVPDGYYNVEFKLYKASALDGGETPLQGACTTNPGAAVDEDCLWTETRINADKVRVANGYLTVNLGSVTAFPGNMPWDQQLWLTMNIGGTGSPSWDGEMNPRLKLTATPYAMSTGKVVSSDGTGSATVANGDSGTICIQGSANCGFIKTTSSILQTANTNLSIQGTDAAIAALNVRGVQNQTASLFKVQGYNGAIVEDLFEVNNVGALTLHGPGTVGFVTPNGQTVSTKIRIPLYAPGNFGQVLMFGLPSGAHATSRALTVVDARTVSHQPSIAVLSPNENEIFGLSWDGSNSAAKLKTSSADLILGNASGDAAVFSGTQIDLNRATNVTGNVDLIGANRGYYISGTAVCTSVGCTAAAASAIQNTTSQQTAANFWIDGTGKATALQAGSLDTVTAAGTLTLGATNATGGIALSQTTTIAANKGLVFTGGTSGNRPASPAEGTVFFDTTTKQLIVFANGKWQADRSSSSKTVAMGATTGCTGSVPSASLSADSADYVVTSCTSAQTTINSAITALGSTGGTVYLMEGTYIIDGTITLTANVKIVGAGQATILKFKNSSSTTLNMFTATSISRVSLENVRLDGNKANNGSASAHIGIALTSVGSGNGVTAVPGAVIKGVSIENFQGTGIYLSGVFNTTISDSYFGQNLSYAIDTNTTGSRINILNNEFHNNSVETFGSTYWNVTGNTFDATSNGSYLLDLSNSGNSFHNVSSNTFNGNGMNITGSQNTISANTIVTTNQTGINVTSGANTITGNKVHDTSGSTFSRIVISGSNNTISSNDITAGGGTGYAISIANIGAANNMLTGNRFSGTGSNTISDNGKETIYNSQVTGTNDTVIRGNGGIGLNTSSVTASVTLQGGLQVNQLPAPGSPTVTKQGTHTNSASYTYAVSATDGAGGETILSSTTSVSSAQNTLTGSLFNRISWTRVGGAMSYKIYRTAASGGATGNSLTTGLVGTVNASSTTMQFDDIGAAATGSLPAANTTGGGLFAGGITATSGATTTFRINSTGEATFKTTGSTANAFRVLNSSDVPLFSIDTSANRIQIGNTAADAVGALLVLDTKNDAGDPTGIDGAMYYNSNLGKFRCYQSSAWADCIAASGGFVALQNAYTNSTGGSNSEIKLDSTRGGVDIQDADTPLGASAALLTVRGSNPGGQGSAYFQVQGNGNTTIQSGTNDTAAFSVKRTSGSGGDSVLSVDTTNSRVGVGMAAPQRTLDISLTSVATNAPAIRLYNSTGDASIELKNGPGNKSFYVGQDASNGSSFSIGSSSRAAPSSVGAASFVQSAATSDNATATSISQVLSSNTTTGNTIIIAAVSSAPGAFTMSCGDNAGNTYAVATTFFDTTSFRQIGICYATNITGAATTVTATFGGSSVANRRIIAHEYSGIVTPNGSAVDATAAAAASATTATDAVTSGNGTTTVQNALVFGAVANVSATSAITAGTNFTQRNSLNGKDFATQDRTLASPGSVASTQTFGTNGNRYLAAMVAFKPEAISGTVTDTFNNSMFTLSQTGDASFKGAASTAAFRVLNASDVPQFSVDTSNSRVYIGNPTADTTGALLVLDVKTDAGDPTGVEGGMYYNRNTGTFRCYTTAWSDCAPRNLKKTTGTQTSASATLATIDGLTFTAPANTDYTFNCSIIFFTSTAATGLNLGFAVPTGSTIFAEASIPAAASGVDGSFQAHWNQAAVVAGPGTSPGISSTAIATVEGVLRTSANSGTFSVQFARGGSGTLSLVQASNCRISQM